MSDDFDDFDQDENDEPAQPEGRNPLRSQIKRLEKQVRDLTAKADAGEKAVREAAFLKADLNPAKDKRLSFFINGYDGDLAPEAITAAAIEHGFLEAPADPEAATTPPEEQAAHQRMAGNQAGGQSPAAHNYDARIAEAQAAGDWQTSIALKQEKAANAANR